MRYKFSKALNIDYTELKNYIGKRQELTKKELLEKCSGKINFDLLQNIKEIGFDKIGKDDKDELYLK